MLRQELAQSYTRMQLIKWLGWRARSRKDQGLGPGSVGAEARRVAAPGARRRLVVALQGAAGLLYADDAVNGGYWQNMFLSQWSSRLGGGTEQVQRNVIGERVLGLPVGRPRRQDAAVPRAPEVGADAGRQGWRDSTMRSVAACCS